VKGITWLPALRVYLAVSLGLHLVWEVIQLPLYTIWTTGTFREKVFTATHCALGDVVIAGVALLGGLVVAGSSAWPWQRWQAVFVATLAGGVAYTIYSEWLNTTVRQSWAYSPLMPVLPITGTGLAPLLQWIVVPSTALALTRFLSRSAIHNDLGGLTRRRLRARPLPESMQTHSARHRNDEADDAR
jgi:hypothetical protein